MAEHTFKIGDTVTINNVTIGGREFVEGRATIKKLTPVDHQYTVEFESERGQTYERFAWPEDQS